MANKCSAYQFTRREFIAATVGAAALAPSLDMSDSLAVSSPDGLLTIAFNPDGPSWSVDWQGRAILLPSRLGLLIDGLRLSGLKVAGTKQASHDEVWTQVYGERSEVPDRYHEMAVELRDDQGRGYDVIFRAYNEGAAVAYRLPAGMGARRRVIRRELTSFCFTGDHPCYPVYSAQGKYRNARLSQVRPGCERPLTVKVGDECWAAVAEARLVDYARMRLRPGREQYSLQADLAGKVVAVPPFSTPWRVVMAGASPGELLEHNYLILNLNDPCALADTSWIKPGKVIRDITITTTGAMACVDFAAARGLRYIEIDAGWYGPEGSWLSDARQVSVDPKRSKGPLDLPGVIAYARERGIGVWLYVNRRQLEMRHEELFALYESWGVAGVKFGFVQVGAQRVTDWLHRAVRKAAEHRLMVDVHDEYRPTGVSRTWPNLLTQEGVRGNEEMPTAKHNLYLPFTRLLAGAADCTICWQDPRIQTSYAHQMAAAVVFYSPLQFLYWYDQPGQVINQPALSFFDRLPTVWDETRVLQGEVGKYITMARRSGGQWFVGTMNGGRPRELNVNLSFLDPDVEYEASIFDDRDGPDPKDFVTTVKRKVTSTDFIRAQCQDNGGQAIMLRPQ